MATENHPFYSLWAQGDIREHLFAHLSKSDICAVRLSNSACCNLVTRRLFQRIHLTFTPNSFTRPYRVEALARIGHHVEHLTFYMPHSEATFLPPLIHPATGAEISYLYTPHTSMASTLTRPKYGNSELGDILTQQYPPMFHASTNVPSFINAVKHVPNLRHLTIKTPGQNPAERYRRDIVDYALMSLRIAVERSPYLTRLSKLSLHGVHPAAFLYLKFQDGPGFGCSPNAGKRWRQIRRMHVAVEAWDFYGPGGPGLDQLKIIDDYLRQFSGTLEKLSFTWLGGKGPCPLALAEDPLFDTPRENRKLFNEVTSPMSPLPPTPGVRGRIHFRRLRNLQVRNASMHAAQLRGLVESHRETVKEFDFENVVLHNGGNWDEALAPLMSPPPQTPQTPSTAGGGVLDSNSNSNSNSNRDTWARYSVPAGDGKSVHSVHTQYSAAGSRRSGGGGGGGSERSPSLPEEAFVASPAASRHSIAAEHDDVPVRHPSAAVEAVGKDLLDLDMDGLEAYVGLPPLRPSQSQTSCSSSGAYTVRDGGFDDGYGDGYGDGDVDGEEYVYYGDEQETIIVELDEDIDSAINLASTNGSDATLVPFSTKLKKRVRKRRRKPWHPKREGDLDGATDDDDGPGPAAPGPGLHQTRSNRSQDRLVGEKNTLRNILGGHKRSNSSSQSQQQQQPQPQPQPQYNKLQKAPPAPITVYGPAVPHHSRVRQSSDPMPYGGQSNNPTTYELPLVIASDDETAPAYSHRNNSSSSARERTTQWPRPRAASEAIPPPPSYLPPPPPSLASYTTLPRPAASTQSLQSVLERGETGGGGGGGGGGDGDGDDYFNGNHAPMEISAPIISMDALPVLLQPAVYSPQASTASIPMMVPVLSRHGSSADSVHSTSNHSVHSVHSTSNQSVHSSSQSIHSTHSAMSSRNPAAATNNNGNGHNVNDGLSAVQRNLEQEETQRRFAEDAEARTSALKRAREAVLEKLGRLRGEGAGGAGAGAHGGDGEDMLLDMHPALQGGDDDYDDHHHRLFDRDATPRPSLSRERSGSGKLKELFGAVKGNGRGGVDVEGVNVGGGVYQQGSVVQGSDSALVPLVFSVSRS